MLSIRQTQQPQAYFFFLHFSTMLSHKIRKNMVRTWYASLQGVCMLLQPLWRGALWFLQGYFEQNICREWTISNTVHSLKDQKCCKTSLRSAHLSVSLLSFPVFISWQKSVHTLALPGLRKSRSHQTLFDSDEAGSLEGFHLLGGRTRQGDNSIAILKLRYYKNRSWKYPDIPEDSKNSLES